MTSQTCKNCNNYFTNNFCSDCGQRNIANKRLKINEVSKDFLDNTLNIHKGFFFTLWGLISNPGHVALSYINGQRKTFTNPTRYLVIAIAFQTFIDYWFNTDEILKKDEYFYFPFLSDQINKNMEIWNIKLAIDYALLSNLFEVLVFPVILYLLFKSLKFNFTELLTTNFYYIATSTFITMVILFITKVIFNVFVSIEVIASVVTIYIAWAYLSFFKTIPLFSRVLKLLLAISFFFVMRVFFLPLILSVFYPLL